MKPVAVILIALIALVMPGLGQDEGEPSEIPSYIAELRELAKLRDEGVITEEDFELKKRKLLGLDSEAATTEADKETRAGEETKEQDSLIVKHCKKGLLTLVKSPASTKYLSVNTFSSPELPRGMKRYVAEGQDISAPGTTVYIEYDSSNSYGALMRGKISCDYTDPPFFDSEITMIPRTVLVNGSALDKNRVKLFGLSASLEMLPDFIAHSKDLEGAEGADTSTDEAKEKG